MSQTSPIEIIELGNPILRQVAEEVTDVFDENVQRVIDALISGLDDYKGIGLAAPQIGVSLRIYVIGPSKDRRYPHATLDDTLAVINPQIRPTRKKRHTDWEGCLSIPGIRGLVPRYEEIEVTYTNRLGEVKREVYKDLVARIFQHEHDHLDGVVFLDRMNSVKDIITDREYAKFFDDEGSEE